jgi:hypothetical protein
MYEHCFAKLPGHKALLRLHSGLSIHKDICIRAQVAVYFLDSCVTCVLPKEPPERAYLLPKKPENNVSDSRAPDISRACSLSDVSSLAKAQEEKTATGPFPGKASNFTLAAS